MKSISLECAGSGQLTSLNDNPHSQRQILVRRQCGNTAVEIYWDRKSGFLRGRVHRRGKIKSIAICGISIRRIEEGQLPNVRRFFDAVAVKVQENWIEIQPRLRGGVNPENEKEIGEKFNQADTSCSIAFKEAPEIESKTNAEKFAVSISYHPNSEQNVKNLEKNFFEGKPIVREKDTQKSDLAILFVTKDYLTSENCIYEAMQLKKCKETYRKKIYIIYDQEILELRNNKKNSFLYANECCQHWNGEIDNSKQILDNPDIEMDVKTNLVSSYLKTLCRCRKKILGFIKKDVFGIDKKGLSGECRWLTLEELKERNFQPLEEKFNELKEQKKKLSPKKTFFKEYLKPVFHFIGRKKELEKLGEIITPVEEENEETKIVVLTGLGGVGKTQLARKFVAESHSNYSIVYTLNGQSEELLNQSYRILAQRLGLKIENIPSEDIFPTIKGELEKSTYKGWLLLFDNADDHPIVDSLYDKLPQHGGNILITSSIAVDLENATVIPVNKFERSDSIELLATIILKDRPCNYKTLDELAEALGDLPLALTQASAYINNSTQRGYNAAKYLTVFQKSYADSAIKFTKFKGAVDYHNRRIITATWDTSRESIRKNCPLADETLCLLAYLNPEKIPSDWIEKWLQNRGIQDEDELEETASKIISTLYKGYSMIHYEEQEGISIHRLVQRVVQESLTEEEQKKFIGEALRLVQEKFNLYNYNDPETWGIGRTCLPHAINITAHVFRHYPDFNKLEDSEKEIPEKMGKLFYRMGQYADRQGNTSQAKEYFEQSLRINKSFYGENHPEVAATLHALGQAWSALGENKKAIELYEQSLRISKSFYGENHPSVAATLHALGQAWSALGEKKKAIELYEQDLRISKSFYGENHPSVAATLHALGQAWSALGEKKKAIELYEQDLRISKSFYGENHPSVAATLNALGQAWSALGENKKAIELYEQSLRINKSFYGENHPEVAATLHALGHAWSALGEKKKAIELYEQSLRINKSFYGENHPSVAATLNALGQAWSALGENKKAIELYEQDLRISKSFYGENHPSVAATLHALGQAWSALGEKKKAIELYEQDLRISKSFYGENHPSVAATLNALGQAWSALGEKKKAIELYEQSLRINKSFYGENHPEVAATLNALGSVLYDLGEKEKAIGCLEQAYTMHTQFFGEDHPDTCTIKSNLDYVKGNEPSSVDLNTLLMLFRALSNKEEGEESNGETSETLDQNALLRQILANVSNEEDTDGAESTESSIPQCPTQ